MAEVLQTANHIPRGVGLVSVQLHGSTRRRTPGFPAMLYPGACSNNEIHDLSLSMSRYIPKVTFA